MRAMVLHKLGEFGQIAAKMVSSCRGLTYRFSAISANTASHWRFKSFPLSITDIEIVPVASPPVLQNKLQFYGRHGKGAGLSVLVFEAGNIKS